MRWSFKSILRFLALIFWIMPIRREVDKNCTSDIKFSYGMLALVLALYFFYSKPYFFPGTFPEFSQLSVTEGVLIHHPTRRDGKYTNEPIGLRTDNGDVYKECSTLGVPCLAGPGEPKNWQSYVGKHARMWFWGEWLVQLEIDGLIPSQLSYEKKRGVFTSLPGALWGVFLVSTYLLFRLIQRYGRTAFNEAFKTNSTSNSLNLENK